VPADSPTRRRIFVCRPENRDEEAGCATTICPRWRAAYRRPVTREDVETLRGADETREPPAIRQR
jgi:hypothetical protein